MSVKKEENLICMFNIIEMKKIWIMYVQIFKLYDGMQNVPF